MNEKSSMLWHKRLGHISRNRLERLERDGILENLVLLSYLVQSGLLFCLSRCPKIQIFKTSITMILS